jgi:hypothetical protein
MTNDRPSGGGGWLSAFLGLVEQVAGDVTGLRRAVRKQGHAAEMRHEELRERLETLEAAVGAGQAATGQPASLSEAQLESLCRLDESLVHLLRTEPADGGEPEAPATAAEALAMVQVRVRNLQRSFGLEAVPSVGQPFDDRLHHVHSVSERYDVGDGIVVEELRPGYTLGGRVLRPALVVVNRRR